MATELAFEYLLAAVESVKGTAVDPPTRYLNLAGTLTPRAEVYRPTETNGLLAEYTRTSIMRKWSELEAEGPADVYTLPMILESCIKGAATIATPGGGTNSRTHTYVPTMTSDDLKSLTIYSGDPNVQAFQTDYMMIDEVIISADATSTDGAQMSIKGTGHFPAKDAPNSLPTYVLAPIIAPADMELFIDTSTIGSTEVTGRLLSAEITIQSGVVPKWLASGTPGTLEFASYGRRKRHAELKLVLEVPDLTQYDQWAAATVLKTRLKLNGPIIESTLRHYIQLDIYGPFTDLEWSEYEGTNRTVELTIMSQYDSTATHDFQVIVQNDLTTV
jgi:hypothetical protein